MDLRLQYITLGTLQSGKYTFDKKKNILVNTATKQPVKPMFVSGRMCYRIVLGYSQRIDMPLDEILYLLNFGIYNPNAKVLHKDEDPLNNLKENLTLSIIEGDIPNDIKHKIEDMFAHGKGYAEIGRKLNVNRQTVKQIVHKKYGNVHPHQYCSTKLLVDSMKRDMNGFKMK